MGDFFSNFRYLVKYWNYDRIKLLVRNITMPYNRKIRNYEIYNIEYWFLVIK